jgi:hypothetical protein
MGIHLLRCIYGDEHIGTHDIVCDTFVDIASNISFHMGWEQLHVFFSTMFNSLCPRLDIDGIYTLVDVVIADPRQVDIFPWSCAT